LIAFELNDESNELLHSVKEVHKVPLIGLYQVPNSDQNQNPGRIAVFGDSSCFDSSTRQPKNDCNWLIRDLLSFTNRNIKSKEFLADPPLTSDYKSRRMNAPSRRDGSHLAQYSGVINKQISCTVLNFKETNVTIEDVVIEWFKEEKIDSGKVFFEELHSRKTQRGKAGSLWIPIVLLITSLILVYLVFYKSTFANTNIFFTRGASQRHSNAV